MAKLNGVTTKEIFQYNGVDYVKSAKKVEAGDIVRMDRVSSSDCDVTNGAYYVVNRVDSLGDAHITDDSGSDFDTVGDELTVFKPLTSVNPQPQPLSIGDYAKVTGGPNPNTKPGDIVRITKVAIETYGIADLNGNDIGGKRFEWAVRATEKEVAVAKAEAAAAQTEEKWAKIGRKVGEIKAGDIVRITNYEYGDAKGTIVKVRTVREDRSVSYTSLNGRLYGACADSIELIAPVESLFNGGAAV